MIISIDFPPNFILSLLIHELLVSCQQVIDLKLLNYAHFDLISITFGLLIILETIKLKTYFNSWIYHRLASKNQYSQTIN